MPSRRKQTVGSCQFAQGHCWSTPCGGAGNLTEGSSLHRVQPSFCLEAYCPSLTVRTQPKINPPSCWFSLLCLSQWATCVDWAASIQHCNSGFITKRIDKKHQPSVSAMMCIFDGISMALQIHHLVCMPHRVHTDRLSRQWAISASRKLRFLSLLFWIDDHLIAEIRLSQHRAYWLCWENKCCDCCSLTNPSCWLVLEQWEPDLVVCEDFPQQESGESICRRPASQWQLLQEPGFIECVMSGVFSSC